MGEAFGQGRLARAARRLRGELRYYRRLLAHPRTPRGAKLCLAGAIAYLLSPIDLVPDFIPVLGFLDDLVIVGGLVWLGLRLVPEAVRRECRDGVQ